MTDVAGPRDRRSRAFTDTLEDAFVCSDASGRILAWSAPAARMFGLAAASAIGRPVSDLLVRGAERVRLADILERPRADRTERVRFDSVAQPETGDPFPVEISLSTSHEGELEWFFVFRDARAQQLREREIVATHRVQAIGTLAATIAHDFNNALAVIMSLAALVEDELPADSVAGGDIRDILRAAQRARGLTRQLLAFAGKQASEPRVIDTNEELDTLLRGFRRILPENVILEASTSQRLSRIEIDPAQLEQILLNLIVNARDAMPDGGTLSVRAQNVEVHAEAALAPALPPGRFVEITVSDTGVGIPSSLRERIFEPLFTTKAPGHGTGLGLATVRAILAELKGALSVTSTPGEGSTFRVYLPRAAVSGPLTVSSVRPANELRGTENILVVEDDVPVREMLRRVLEQAGYCVIEASNAGEALLVAEKETRVPALVLSDVVLPRMSGQELAERLVQLLPGVSVLLMSGYTPPEMSWPFIAKPFTPRGLLERVRATLNRR